MTEAEVFLYFYKEINKFSVKISEYMGLTSVKNRNWAIFKCSALTGYGLNDGMEWLVNALKS